MGWCAVLLGWCAVLLGGVLPLLVSGQRQVVDLSHTRGVNTIYWPGVPRFNFSILYRGVLDNHWLESNWFSTSEHGGTHLDAPAHFSQGSPRVHQIPPRRLVGPGVVINVSIQATRNPDYEVAITDVTSWELTNGRIPQHSVVMMNSGWDRRYPNRSEVFNTNSTEDPKTFRYPGWHVDTVNWLVLNRAVIVIGVDTPSTDHGQTPSFPVHQALGRQNISGLENIANLGDLPPRGFTVFVGVIKIYDGSGGPARVLALMDDPVAPCNCPVGVRETRAQQERSTPSPSSGSSSLSTSACAAIVAMLNTMRVMYIDRFVAFPHIWI